MGGVRELSSRDDHIMGLPHASLSQGKKEEIPHLAVAVAGPPHCASPTVIFYALGPFVTRPYSLAVL